MIGRICRITVRRMSTLDHLVVATPDLSATVAALTAALGVAPVAGGRHDGIGTRNHLLGLAEGGYLEVIGIDTGAPTPAAPRPFGLDTLDAPRLSAWLVRVDGLAAAVEKARAAGHDPGDPRPLGRTTPEGVELCWELATPADTSGVAVVPYLIDWLDSPHPSAALPTVDLVSFTATHPDPERAAAALDALGARLPVARGTSASLTAELSGPGGRITLT